MIGGGGKRNPAFATVRLLAKEERMLRINSALNASLILSFATVLVLTLVPPILYASDCQSRCSPIKNDRPPSSGGTCSGYVDVTVDVEPGGCAGILPAGTTCGEVAG